MKECRAKGPVLFYSSLYPGKWNPAHGLFVYELRRAMRAITDVPVVVPENGLRKIFSPSPPFAFEGEGETSVLRQKFWTIPKAAKAFDGTLMALWTRSTFGKALEFRPWVVHAHYAFPEAVAAAELAEEAGLPLVVTAHGSDINELAECIRRRERIVNALMRADAVVAVSGHLYRKICDMGIPSHKVFHIPNGVSLELFSVRKKLEARKELALPTEGPLLVAVGRLEPVKGYDRLLKAVAKLPSVTLAFAGDGSLRKTLEAQATELGIAERVVFMGMLPHVTLAACYQAADLMVMSSHSEGWPTVAYEAMACGTPVVAPPVGGIPEIVHSSQLGLIAASNSPEDLQVAIAEALTMQWDPDVLRAEAEQNSWDAIARRYVDIYWRVG